MSTPSASDEAVLGPNKLLAVAELLVSLHNFVNIELHAQGWYAIRITLAPDPAIRAIVPAVVYNDEAIDMKYAAVLDEGKGVYQSRVFSVRYCYEEVPILETVSFSLYLSKLQSLEQFSCVMEVELLLHEADLQMPDLEPPVFQLRPVAKEVLRVGRLASGVVAYHAATFDIHHFCLCHIGVFGTMRGFTTKRALQDLPSGLGGGMSSGSMSSQDSRGGGGGSSGWAATLLGAPLCRAGSADVYRMEEQLPGSERSSRRSRNSGACRRSSTRAVMGRAACARHFLIDDPAVRQALQEVADAPVKAGGKWSAASDATKMERVAGLFKATAAAHQRGCKTLVQQLRQLPPNCYAPQNFATIKALLALEVQGAAANGDSNGSSSPSHASRAGCPEGAASLGRASNHLLQQALQHNFPSSANLKNPAAVNGRRTMPRSEGGSGASCSGQHAPLEMSSGATEVNTWQDFVKALPPNCSPGAAVLHLEALLHRLRDAMNLDWAILLWVLRHSLRELLQCLKAHWEAQQFELTKPWLVRELKLPLCDGDARQGAVAARRQQLMQKGSATSDASARVLLLPLWEVPAQQPILFVDASMAKGWTADAARKAFGTANPKDEAHVMVFVHGFQGAASDLSLVKGQLSMMYPHLECFLSRANEGNTGDSIQEMGSRLAQELLEFITPFSQSTRRPLTRISFVGHSIGNLILRSALTAPCLAPYIPLLWLYLSISGPHMGFLYSSNAVLDTGMRVLKSLGRGKCLHQLSFTDGCSQRECYLYQLSQQSPGIAAFRHAVLVYSPQDRYVPLHSAQVSMCEAAQKDGKKGAVCKEMVDALLKNTGGPGQTHLYRVDVDFELDHKSFSLSKLVGRTAHIEFLECSAYVRMLLWGVVHHHHLLQPSSHAWL